MDTIFGAFALGIGIYCLYACVMMKRTGVINKIILLSNDMQNQQCKDTKAYINEVIPKVLILGVGAIIYGSIDLINTHIYSFGKLFFAFMGLFLVLIIWIGVLLMKVRKKYF